MIVLMAAEAYFVYARHPKHHLCNMFMLMTLLYKLAAHHGEIRCCISYLCTVTSWYEACAYTRDPHMCVIPDIVC